MDPKSHSLNVLGGLRRMFSTWESGISQKVESGACLGANFEVPVDQRRVLVVHMRDGLGTGVVSAQLGNGVGSDGQTSTVSLNILRISLSVSLF